MNIIEIIDNIEYTELYINNQKIGVQEANLNAEFLKDGEVFVTLIHK